VKVIFLDCDGVLNAPDYWEHFIWTWANKIGIKMKGKGIIALERKFVHRLDWIIRKTGAKIVISSSWRNTFTDWYQWHQLFSSMGYDTTGDAVISLTSLHEVGVIRGDEIKQWLDNPPKGPKHREIKEAVSGFVILDDDGDFTEDQKASHFVQTDGRKGLTWKDARKAVKVLRNPL